MMLLIKIAALQFVWLASLSVYLTATQQAFLKKPINKKLAWLAFSILSFASVFVFSQVYHPLTSVLFTLCAVMTSWIVLALTAGQFKNIKRLFFSGLLAFTFVGFLGGSNVG